MRRAVVLIELIADKLYGLREIEAGVLIAGGDVEKLMGKVDLFFIETIFLVAKENRHVAIGVLREILRKFLGSEAKNLRFYPTVGWWPPQGSCRQALGAEWRSVGRFHRYQMRSNSTCG